MAATEDRDIPRSNSIKPWEIGMKYFVAHVIILLIVLSLFLIGTWALADWPIGGKIVATTCIIILVPCIVERFLSTIINRSVDSLCMMQKRNRGK